MPKRDTTPPKVSITSPAAGASVSGQTAVSGTASDNVGVAAVRVSVDGGSLNLATGTASWTKVIDTTLYPDGAHTIHARALDAASNKADASVSVTFKNAVVPAPSPAPTASFATSPASGVAPLTVAFTDTSSGSPTAWTWSFGDGGSSSAQNPSHTYQTAGSYTVTLLVSNSGGSNTTARAFVVSASGTTPPTVADQMVTPEGATIQVYSDVVGGWTAQKVYDLLKPNAYELAKLGPTLTVKVQTQYASTTSAGASSSGGIYTGYKAICYLQATSSSSFTNVPDDILTHEYGHAWTLYHLYLSQNNDYSKWLAARGLTGDSRLESSYMWSKNEILAEDYRLLFGTATAQGQTAQMNYLIPDARTVSGLRTFFTNTWAA